jgi:hypothetical protein
MFPDFYRGNRTPMDRLRAAQDRVDDLEYRLKQAKEALAAATAEVVAFNKLKGATQQSSQESGGLLNLF